MKLSNKILIGFFLILFLYLTAVVAELRLTGTRNTLDEGNSLIERENLQGITCLQINNLSNNIYIVGAEESRIEVQSASGELMKSLPYRISGDTLTLSGTLPEAFKASRITIFAPANGFAQIRVDSSVAIIEELNQTKLSIFQNDGRIWMENSTLGILNLTAVNESTFDISGNQLDTLNIAMESSQVNVTMPVSTVKGSIRQNAVMVMHGFDNIQIDKDKTSVFHLNQ